MAHFGSILVVARGATAVRIVRTTRALGYRTVVAVSPDEVDSPVARAADLAVETNAVDGGDAAAILAAARRAGADAVLPGPGPWARGHALAEACQREGLVHVGPPPETSRLIADRRLSRLCARGTGIAILPGYDDVDQGEGRLRAEARRIGYPLTVSAADRPESRRVAAESELAPALRALRGDGDAAVTLERALPLAREVAVPVLADRHGTVVHLAEREVTARIDGRILVEEAPSPAVDAELRERLGAAAVALAGAVDHVGVGTVSFLVEAEGRFAFLGMTSGIVDGLAATELVTGLDLVAWQIRVAEGEPLPLAQHAIPLGGHAMAARLGAGDDRPVAVWLPPSGPGIRVDHALAVGSRPGRDPLAALAALAAFGTGRDEARRRLAAAIEDTVLLGPATDRDLCAAVLRDETVAGAAGPDAVEARLAARAEPPPTTRRIALAALLLAAEGETALAVEGSAGRWQVAIEREGAGACVAVDGERHHLRLLPPHPPAIRVACDGLVETAHAATTDSVLHLDFAGGDHHFRRGR